MVYISLEEHFNYIQIFNRPSTILRYHAILVTVWCQEPSSTTPLYYRSGQDRYPILTVAIFLASRTPIHIPLSTADLTRELELHHF